MNVKWFLHWKNIFKKECNFATLKQCFQLSQINIKQNSLHIVIFIVSSSKIVWCTRITSQLGNHVMINECIQPHTSNTNIKYLWSLLPGAFPFIINDLYVCISTKIIMGKTNEVRTGRNLVEET